GAQIPLSNQIARWISDLANPLFIPPCVLILVGTLVDLSLLEMSWLVLLSILFYTAIPFITALSMLNSGKIESLDLPDRASRNLLYLAGVGSATLGSLILGFMFYLHRPFLTLIAGVFVINPVIGYLLNRKWKVSIHAGSIASGGIILLFFYYWTPEMTGLIALFFSLTMLLVLLPVMMWSRFNLGVHSLPELLGGATSGIVFTSLEILLTFYFWQPL
ncbi:MAG: hypothetical protein R3281_17275, partial [Balneolaceae bacterium]|nr:hypothetical protein [Balneolaceae bacterium]